MRAVRIRGFEPGDGYATLVLDVSVDVDNDVPRAYYASLGFEDVDTVTLEALDQTFHLAAYRQQLPSSSETQQGSNLAKKSSSVLS